MASAGRTRPSLLGTAPAPHPPADFEVSILEALHAPQAAVARRPRRGLGAWAQAGLVLVGIGALATTAVLLWMPTPAAPAADEAPLAARAEPATAPAPAEAAAPAASGTLAVATAEAASAAPAVLAQAARIEEVATPSATPPNAAAEPASAAAGVPPSPFDKLATAAEPAPAPTPAPNATAKATAKATTKAPRTGKATTAKPVPAKAGTAVAAREKDKAARPTSVAAAPARAGSPAAARTAPAKVAKAGTPADADVEIMAALIGHMNEPAAGKVLANDASIADLVQHCRSLPGGEAQSCQRRICQGYWGRAEACPARERPASVRTAG